MSFRNVLMAGGLSLVGLAVLLGVADQREDGLLPGSAKPRGGGFATSPLDRAPAVARRAEPAEDGVRRAEIRRAPAPGAPGPDARGEPPAPPLLDRVVDGALSALRAARAAGDRVFGRDRADVGAEAGAGADPAASRD